MMMEEKYINYLNDTLKNVIDRALKIKKESGEFDEFNEGLQQGYCEVISHLLLQAESFEIKNKLDRYLQKFKTEDIVKGTAKSPWDRENN